MNQSDFSARRAVIKQKITDNISQAKVSLEDIRVQSDPFNGWRIAVVSSGFKGKSDSQRKEIVLEGLENIDIQLLYLLTPEEKEWAGVLPLDSTLENLPLWPEALELSSKLPEEVVFPSDLDDDLKLPIITTFYSLRGGVGRSTALAYTARILAKKGYTVLCVDMDLEAPGLTALFNKEAEIKEGQGLLSILLELDQGNQPNIQDHIIRISETDELYCLPAGLPNANYASWLNLIDPSNWYREEKNPLHDLIDNLSHKLSFKPDVILLDARTGITPLNGPLLFDLADLAIIVFFPHPQSKTGTEALVRALLASKTMRPEKRLTPEPRFLISPIPASKAPEVIEKYQHRGLEWISQWLSELQEKRPQEQKIITEEITHFIPYREVIATSDQISSERDIWQDFNPVAEWIELFLPTRSEQHLEKTINLNLTAELKSKILDELEFSPGTAEYQANFLDTYITTELVQKALQPNTPLVLGRKGTGKTAIFRQISEAIKRPSIVVISPEPLKKQNFWVPSSDGFKAIEEILIAQEVSWREFWTIQICLAYYFSQTALWAEKTEKQILPEESLAEFLRDNPSTELQVFKCLEKMLTVKQLGLLARDWLQGIDKGTKTETILLFDGLDTGFGNTETDRSRRTKAIEELLSLVLSIGDSLQHLKFKVLLREDIWRKLIFDNKSHFFGRSVTLNWENKTNFFQVAIKQAMLSSTFKELVGSILGSLKDDDYWLESNVFEIWNVLVGERMKGGKSAFTKNWVWNRLADGSDNRSPRALLQLLKTAKEWEQKEQKRNPYQKTIIRSRALTSCLEEVSRQALDALIKEEFPDLDPLVKQLKNIGSSPLKVSDLSELDKAIVNLGLQVGLLAIYEGTDDKIIRYKVPDLYLLGIGMKRKGQA